MTTLKVVRAAPIRRRVHGQAADKVKAITEQLNTIRAELAQADGRMEDVDARLAKLERETRLLSIHLVPTV